MQNGFELKIHVFVVNQIADDVEFWFPPGKKSTVEYRSASRIGNLQKKNQGKVVVNLLNLLPSF